MQFMQTSAEGARADGRGADERLGTRVGPWRLEARIGSGGMGHVYRAVRDDGLYDQQVALKIVRLADAESVARFERERRMLAALEHPGIARIVDGGTDEGGTPYMATEYVDGVPIADHVAEVRATPAQIAQLVTQLARAESHAHSRLVLHRDIKSDNVLVDDGGRVRLIDFGISGEVAQTGGDGAMTAAVTAPEVLAGEPASVRADIFSTGVLLATLLAGQRPSRGEDGGMRLPAGAVPDRDLAAIAEKAMRADPDERYASIDALAADLDAWREHRPVAARGTGGMYVARRFARRFRLPLGLAGLAVLALVAGLGAALWQRGEALAARDEAEARLLAAEFFREEAEINSRQAMVLSGMFNEIAADAAGFDDAAMRDFVAARGDAVLEGFANDPRDSANALAAIAYFLQQKGDYERSARFTQHLLDAPGVPEILHIKALEMQGRNFHELGRAAESVAMTGEALAQMRLRPFLLETGGYVDALANHAMRSREPKDLNEALARLQIAAENEADGDTRSYWFSQSAMVATAKGDTDAAIRHSRAAFDLSRGLEANNNFSLLTRQLNLVHLLLYGAGDAAEARRYMPDEDILFGGVRGHIRHRAYYRWMQSLIAQVEGDDAEAVARAREAVALARAELPATDRWQGTLSANLADSLVLAGRPGEARALLPQVWGDAPRDGQEAASLQAHLTEALIYAGEGRDRQARAALRRASADAELMRNQPPFRHRAALVRERLAAR